MARTVKGLTGSERRYRIRRIFLRRQDWYSPKLVTRLTGVSSPRLRAMVAAGEIEVHPAEKEWERRKGDWRMKWPQLAALALDIWSMEIVEEELGEDAAYVLPPLVRTVPLTIRLPRYLATMLEILTWRDGVSADRRIAEALISYAEENASSLETDIPGFGEALDFPKLPS